MQNSNFHNIINDRIIHSYCHDMFINSVIISIIITFDEVNKATRYYKIFKYHSNVQ